MVFYTKFLINYLRKHQRVILVLVLAIGIGFWVLPSQALAQTSEAIRQNLVGFGGPDLSVQWLVNFLRSFVCYLIRFAIITISIMMVIYGIMFLKSRGSPQGMISSRKALIWGIVGGIVIFGVFTIILSVANLIGVDYPILQIINC